MKTNLRLKELGIVLVLLFSTFIFSCTKEVPSDITESDLTLKSLAIPQPDDMVCDLMAGQTINVGQVVYSHVGNTLLVEYVTTGGWMLSEVHFYVGNMADFQATCMNKTAVQIGKFPYSATNLNSTTKSFEIDLTGIVPDAGGYLVVAHAVVNKPGQEETAFANCNYKPVIAVKSKIKDGYWAVANGDFIPNPNNYGCAYFATNTYKKGDIYSLIGPYYPTPGQAGFVEVTDNGMSLLISVKANVGLKLSHTYLYVGTMPGFISYIESSTCVNYETFPFKVDTPDGADTHNFSLPLPNVSFETAFGSNRWGWTSYYNF